MNTCLGLELGSTRIKAVSIDEAFQPVSSGDYTWASRFENGVWTYPLEEVWTGLKAAISKVEDRQTVAAMGVSAMMHGYLAFDRDWNLLTPFRTWQCTSTGPAAAELTELFGFNIPQRWSVAHLYQAVLNGEEHIFSIAHITTLAGYVHHMLTGVNAVAPRTGNVSAGTSIFSMVVLEKPLKKVHEEIDLVTTPAGAPVAMVHCNNCTNDTNAWVSVLGEAARLFGADPSTGELYTRLYEKSLEGEADCGGVLVCNYLAGEGVTRMDAGRPLVARTPETRFTLANFFRAQLYATMATLKIGMDILAEEGVAIDSLTGHGGLFKTPVVGQSYLAAACGAPVTCMETAGEGGPYGMALLAAYMLGKSEGERLEDFLGKRVFAETAGTTVRPDPALAEGFNTYIHRYKALLKVEQTAVEHL